MRTRSFLALTLGVILVGAACGGPGATSSAPAATSPAATSPAATSPASSPSSTASRAAGGETVMVADSSLGKILVDGEGRTLYAFTNDKNGESSCYGDCEAKWPPLLAEGDITVGTGLDDGDFDTTDRTDGKKQVKIGDWPLYYWAGDTAPGDTKGQKVGGVWFVVSPEGELIKT